MRVAIVLLSSVLAACGPADAPVVISDVEISRPMPGSRMSAGFLVVTNNTSKAIHITHVESPQFERVEIHETIVSDGVSRMRKLEDLLIPADGSVRLERGGKHLMLMKPRQLNDTVTLHFLNEDVTILTVDYALSAGSPTS